MDSGPVVTFLGILITRIWGMRSDQFVYEGCDVILSDGKPCTLEKMARRIRIVNPSGVDRTNSRKRMGHTCKQIGEGKQMYYFKVQIDNEVMNVWEQAAEQLFGLIGQQFSEIYTTTVQQSETCRRVMECNGLTLGVNQLKRM